MARKKKKVQRFNKRMKRRLSEVFIIVFLIFVFLGAQVVSITKHDGKDYEKVVLSQRKYDSKTLPYRRGEILDKNGTVLAVSEKVYNVILDVRQLVSSKSTNKKDPDEIVNTTVDNLVKYFGFNGDEIKQYIKDNKTSAYHILAKELPYDKVEEFEKVITPGADKYNAKVKGVWLEPTYIRKYPNNIMACDILGFTNKDNDGQFGLEEYYSNTLNGIAGREYGYLDDNSDLERTTIPAQDGNSIVTTIDGNIQGIVEKYLQEFNDTYANAVHEGNAAENVGCIVMNVNNGNILAMSSYPFYNPNTPKDTSRLLGMRMVDMDGKKVSIDAETGGYINEANLAGMSDELVLKNLNALWKNFCVSATYEPGSVAKPFTVAAAIDSGKITGNEVYTCNGGLDVAGTTIRCHNRFGDGQVSVERSIEISCNVALMQMAQACGPEIFAQYQHTFGFGLKTNADIVGEARTAGLVYPADKTGPTELATGSFGQGFNVTMIETIAAFSSLINGGYYYQPHFVSEILSPNGATVKNIEPRIIRQTISESTSKKIVQYCNAVVSGEEGTGKTARPAGYMIGGKTGTAETIPRDKKNYVVSFMGYAPANNPQIAIYVVVDRPNAAFQADAKFATRIVRKVLTEVMPYLHFPMTEELSDEEKQELESMKVKQTPSNEASSNSSSDGSSSESGENSSTSKASNEDNAAKSATRVWESFKKDPNTGYYIDPENGNLINPETGEEMGGESSLPNSTAGSAEGLDDGDTGNNASQKSSNENVESVPTSSEGNSVAGNP